MSRAPVLVGEIRACPTHGHLAPYFDHGLPDEGTVIFAPTAKLMKDKAKQWADRKQNPEAPAGLQVFSVVRDADSYGLCVHYQGVWQEGTPLYVVEMSKAKQVGALFERVDLFWDHGFEAGAMGRANDPLAYDPHYIRSSLNHMVASLVGSEQTQQGRKVQINEFFKLLDQYWRLAYAEGQEGRTYDTVGGDAQATRSALESLVRTLATHPAG